MGHLLDHIWSRNKVTERPMCKVKERPMWDRKWKLVTRGLAAAELQSLQRAIVEMENVERMIPTMREGAETGYRNDVISRLDLLEERMPPIMRMTAILSDYREDDLLVAPTRLQLRDFNSVQNS